MAGGHDGLRFDTQGSEHPSSPAVGERFGVPRPSACPGMHSHPCHELAGPLRRGGRQPAPGGSWYPGAAGGVYPARNYRPPGPDKSGRSGGTQPSSPLLGGRGGDPWPSRWEYFGKGALPGRISPPPHLPLISPRLLPQAPGSSMTASSCWTAATPPWPRPRLVTSPIFPASPALARPARSPKRTPTA